MRSSSRNHIVVPRRSQRRFYGQGIPGVDLDQLAGKLIAVEGADGSGRSTQIAMLVEWLDAQPEVPQGKWFKRFPGMVVCGEGGLIRTFLIPGQVPMGEEIQ